MATIGIVLSVTGCGVSPGDATSDPTAADGGAGAMVDSDGGSSSMAMAGSGPYFTTSMFWNTDVSTVPKATNSASIIAALVAAGGWGNGNRMQIDFALDVLSANATTPKLTFTPTGDFFTPDCDHTAVPVPPGGNIEDETGYVCTGDGDCHRGFRAARR
jgi:hypothetical protein